MTRTDDLSYPIDDQPEIGTALAVAPGLRWMRIALPFALDHVNSWLLDDGDEQVLIDTGIDNDATRAHWHRIFASAAEAARVTRLFITHGHPDHVGLAAWLADRHPATVLMTQGEWLAARAVWQQTPGYGVDDMVAQFRAHGLDEGRLAALASRGNAYRRIVPALPATYRRVFDGDVLRIGNDRWEVIVGYGHSPEHASLYCAEREILISGDMLLPRISTNISVHAAAPDDDPLAWFLASLQRIKNLPENTLVLPSHGRPFRGLRKRIAQLEQHHRDRCDALLSELGSPRQAGELLRTLFPRELDTHQVMFAMGEAVAHFNYLVNRGEARRLVDRNGLVRFQRNA